MRPFPAPSATPRPAPAHTRRRLPGTRSPQKDFGLLDLMFLNLFVIGPTFYISGALNIRGQKNKKD